MQTNLLLIFLLIGVAHWASHVLQCKRCLGTLAPLTLFLLDGVVFVFGWPIHALGYVADLAGFGPKRNAPTKEEIKKVADQIIGQLQNMGRTVVPFEQRPGESVEAFHNRIKETLDNRAEQGVQQ